MNRDEMIISSIPLVKHIVANIIEKHPLFVTAQEDMLGAGYLGLCHAANKYDPDKYSNKFSTYSWYCIRGAILDMLKKERKHYGLISLDGLVFDDVSGDTGSWQSMLEMEGGVADANIPINFTYHEKLLLLWKSHGMLKGDIRKKLRKVKAESYEELKSSIQDKFKQVNL